MRFQTLDEWLSWQEGLHPTAMDLGLTRVRMKLPKNGLASAFVSPDHGSGYERQRFERLLPEAILTAQRATR